MSRSRTHQQRINVRYKKLYKDKITTVFNLKIIQNMSRREGLWTRTPPGKPKLVYGLPKDTGKDH